MASTTASLNWRPNAALCHGCFPHYAGFRRVVAVRPCLLLRGRLQAGTGILHHLV